MCTINPGLFNTGFNDRALETFDSWHDPAVIRPEDAEAIGGFQAAMKTTLQADPQLMIDEMIRLIPSENHRFRETFAPEWEYQCKEYAAQQWAMDVEGRLPEASQCAVFSANGGPGGHGPPGKPSSQGASASYPGPPRFARAPRICEPGQAARSLVTIHIHKRAHTHTPEGKGAFLFC